MFHRRTSQKPTDDLYKKFRADFPQLHHASAPGSAADVTATAHIPDGLDGGLDHHLDHDHEIKDDERTPRANSHDPWNFPSSGLTPSMMDPSSQSFTMFANQAPGYYTPPGGSSTLYHPQAGDLHTPSFGLGLNTPLSLPTSEGGLQAGQGAGAFTGFHPHLTQHPGANPFASVNPMQMHHPTQSSFPPHHFSNHPSFEPLDSTVGESPMDDLGLDVGMTQTHQSPSMLFHSQSLQNVLRPPPDSSGEVFVSPLRSTCPVPLTRCSFRYHTTLNAATAMVKQSEEIPITYLNKGQTYTLSVMDTQAPSSTAPARYRTFVRVSFESAEQRYKPAACWQLWKEGRGTNEAHHRGGRLQAVEYVDSSSTSNRPADDPNNPHMQLESASFDGFCVTWSAPVGSAECGISVRFNFLSTDFSHSKGVKGIPVRLCAKTQLLGESSAIPADVCYCQVKLFRDHGAERKLSNDIAHVKKGIEKVQVQINQLEAGQSTGKRKRAGSVVKGGGSGSAHVTGFEGRPTKIPKHRRTWSLSSVTSGSGRGTVEDDLHLKRRALQDMFTSTRTYSILHLRGAEEDDPDLHPVKISGQQPSLPARTESDETAGESIQTAPTSDQDSPIASPDSARRSSSVAQQQPPMAAGLNASHSEISDFSPMTATADLRSNKLFAQTTSDSRTATSNTNTATQQSSTQIKSQPQSSSSSPVMTNKRAPTNSDLQILDLDPTYTPPQPPISTPIAEFYVQTRKQGSTPSDAYYRAIYLYERSLKALIAAICVKAGVHVGRVKGCVRVIRDEVQVRLADEDVKVLPEGRDLIVEVCELAAGTSGSGALDPRKRSAAAMREWSAGTNAHANEETTSGSSSRGPAVELRLIY